jgi:APA family basic amino acid/polyamine antiporter
MPVIPLIGVASSIWLTTYLTTTTWMRFGIWLLIGLTIYAAYSYRHSHLSTARRT